MELASLLRAFADLAPSGRRAVLDVSRDGPFLWRGAAPTSLERYGLPEGDGPESAGPSTAAAPSPVPPSASVPADATMRRLAALDALHRDERVLREGFAWLCGPVELDGRTERVLLPLVAAPVRVAFSPPRALGPLGRFVLAPAGDREILPLVRDPEAAVALEQRTALGSGSLTDDMPVALLDRFAFLQGWVRDVLAAAGLPPLPVLPPRADPLAARRGDQPVVVVGAAVFVARDVLATDLGNVLRSWAAQGRLGGTALDALYRPGARPADPGGGPLGSSAGPGGGLSSPLAGPVAVLSAVRSPLRLSAAQRQVVERARTEPIVVVSGPPGSGKSHTVAAVAIDAVAQGRSVLVATQSIHAADVLGDLLARQPGPAPIMFGDAERRTDLAAVLAGGVGAGPGQAHLDQRARAVGDAVARAEWLERSIVEALEAEVLASDAGRWEALLPALRSVAPGALDPEADLDAAIALLRSLPIGGGSPARGPAGTDPAAGGWWARRRARRAEARLRAAVRAAPGASLDEVARALQAARARRAAGMLAIQGGTALVGLWDELERAEEEVRLAVGALVSDRARAAPGETSSARRAVAALATALRAGRGARREALRRLDGTALVRALPLWVGTLRDVEDLLPMAPGLFDLVVVDEASQIDQITLAPTLLRGRRAVVSGDPRQLRHVSFVADVDVAATLGEHGLGDWADRLDVRRVSGFDAAAAQAPVTFLDEHHRSVPHLIAFSAERFYPEPVQLVTRHPATEAIDAITVVAVDGRRDDDGVNPVEVDAVEAQVRAFAEAGWRSIGVISPFRAQADALEAMLLDQFELEAITELGLRVGTVHAFQGSEREVVVLSLGLAPGDPAGSRRFVEDPNLFNVMVTRARRHLVVVTSLTAGGAAPPEGLLGDFLAHADTPPAPFPLLAAPAAAGVASPADPPPGVQAAGSPPPGLASASAPIPPPPGRGTSSRAAPGGAPRWATEVGAELARMGLPVRVDYPAGRWTVDLVVGDGEDAVAVEAGVHPGGMAAHLERHRVLRGAGWQVVDAHPTRFERSAARAAIHLAQDLAAGS